uniref:Uncharacterized protein n=1 Tax=Timema douglasi TaxID=61478 RepID=A0A7R8VFA4_TIMDO|nr:unnamed protein product [Timema douglasi]
MRLASAPPHHRSKTPQQTSDKSTSNDLDYERSKAPSVTTSSDLEYNNDEVSETTVSSLCVSPDKPSCSSEMSVIGRLVYCESDALDHVATKVGYYQSSASSTTTKLSVLSVSGTLLQHWVLKTPYAIEELSTDARKKDDYIVNNLHGITWDSGDVDYSLL